MKTSFFKNKFIVGIEDVKADLILDITEEEYKKLKQYKYKIEN